MILDSLLERRLIFLSGKGGVGKSVVGLALAMAARERGHRTLLVEIEAPLEAARHLDSGPVGSRIGEISPGVWAVNLDAQQVMEEYIRQKVRVDLLARRILDSPIYRRFFAAAPGLPELMLLGKIMTLEEERQRRRPRFDLIVVDAPATGHGLAFLKVPLAATKAIPVGPVGGMARRILRLIRDPAKTALAIVAIPEEMAVVEAVQLHDLAVEEIGITAQALVLNRCHERRFSTQLEAEVLRLTATGAAGHLARGIRLPAALASARRQIRRRKLTRFYQSKLRRALPLPLLTLPYLFDEELGPQSIERLAQRIEAT